MDVGGWSIRHWRPLASLTTALLVTMGGLAGYASDYSGRFPALGGPNGLLYDLTLKIIQPWRGHISAAPVVLVAVDGASLASSELAPLPRAFFQPVWARLITGLLEAGARRIAFDVVFVYAASDFKVGWLTLPGYDQTLTDTLARGRDRIVLGRFPSVPPAPAFLAAVGAARVGVLDLQVESDGRVRSTAPLVRLPDGRVAMGFAALSAGFGVRQAASTERILITPAAPLTNIPTFGLATLLECLSSETGAHEVRKAVEGRIIVVGTTIPGEDEHRGPARFLGRTPPTAESSRCAPQHAPVDRAQVDSVPGALLQIAAIQSAASNRRAELAPAWLRLAGGASLAFLFAMMAFVDKSPSAPGVGGASSSSLVLMRLAQLVALGLAGPVLVGCAFSAAAFVFADLWLPMGYPILVTILAFGALRTIRHRALFRRLLQTAGDYMATSGSASRRR